jgi:CheY-like chemotaxis protein
MSAQKKKVLLVEDDDSMRRFIEITLNRAGYETTAAKDGLEGLQFTLKNEFDAVVADAIMTHMSGYDLCRMLRQTPHYQKKPFILLSGLENDNGSNLADAYLLMGDAMKKELTAALSSLLS